MKLLMVGCGHMGQALLGCFEQNPHVSVIHIVDPAYTSPHTVFRHIDAVTETYDVVVLAVKPSAYKDIKGFDHGDPLILSIMAGITEKQLQTDFPNATVVRLMPNMAVAYGKGLTTGYTTGDRHLTEQLLANTGKFLWVDTEAHMNALTIFNGCGPGLLLAVAQNFVDICVSQGFSEDTAETIMRQVFIGTAAMLDNTSNSIAELVASVATKGGITEACLQTMTPPLHTLLVKTVQAGLDKI